MRSPSPPGPPVPGGPPVPDELIRFLREHETFFIVGHVEPDADCLASSLALASFLQRELGKSARSYSSGPFDRREIAHLEDRFATRIDPADRDAAVSPAAIILDCSGPDRVGAIATDFSGLPLAIIDHHATSEPFGDARFVVPTAMASCHLVQLVMEEIGGAMTREEADLLLFGIATDTGYFRHAEADASELFAAVSRLMVAGASPKKAHAWMFGGHTLDSRQLLAALLGRAEPIGAGGGVVTYETKGDTERYGRSSRDSDTLYQLLFSIDGIRTAALIREESDTTVSGSLRSTDAIDVSRIARQFGGGGHKRAAGFTADMQLHDAFERVRAALCTAIEADDAARDGGTSA